MPKKDAQEPQLSQTYIDPDKVAENPHLLPYAHTVGGAVIRPEDKGRLKGRAVKAMYEQTDLQLQQIKEQIELLAQQARHIQSRVQISEDIYRADMNFEPLIGHTYHLYRRSNGQAVLSMVGPHEWGGQPPFTFVATVKMLADHTWEVLDSAE
ncbi:MAG: DUF2452 domain-containing protein [Bacteroidetes bacterium]|nr:MAG: DUF2452 domain-containing protein [Bacteroidota bacterium]